MMTRGRAATIFGIFLLGLMTIARVSLTAEDTASSSTKDKLVVAEARLAEMVKQIAVKENELTTLQREAAINRNRVNAGKEQETKVYRSAEELLARIPKEAYPVAGPNGSIERAATRDWLMEKLGSRKNIFEWEATVKEVVDRGVDLYSVVITNEPSVASGPIVLGEQQCQLRMCEEYGGNHLNASDDIQYQYCTADEVRKLREFIGKKVTFRGIVKKADVISRSATAKAADQPAKPQIEIILALDEITTNGFRPEKSKKTSAVLPELTKEKLLVAEARLADLSVLIPEKEKELAGLKHGVEAQRKSVATAKEQDTKIYHSAVDLLEGVPKDAYPIAEPYGGIERAAAQKWLTAKLGYGQSRFEWEATIKSVEDSEDGPLFTVKLTYDASSLNKPVVVSDVPCQVIVDQPRIDSKISRMPIISYKQCTAEEVRMLRELKGKKVALAGVINNATMGYNKTKNQSSITLSLDKISVNGFLPAANAVKQGGFRGHGT